jgi:hypothetical protein
MTDFNTIFQPFCTPTNIWNSRSGLPDRTYTTYRHIYRCYVGGAAGYEWRDRKWRRKSKVSAITCRHTESTIVSGVPSNIRYNWSTIYVLPLSIKKNIFCWRKILSNQLLSETGSLPLFTTMSLTYFFPPIFTNCLSQTLLTEWR